MEFCRDVEAAGAWPTEDLSFFYLGVHGKGVSLAPFKELPFRRVGWSCATEDCTMLRAAGDDVEGYVARVRDEELPAGAKICMVYLVVCLTRPIGRRTPKFRWPVLGMMDTNLCKCRHISKRSQKSTNAHQSADPRIHNSKLSWVPRVTT